MSKNPKAIRITRNISLPPDMDAWLTELLGDHGNLSGFIQGLIDLARSGKVDTRELLERQPESDNITRAVNYLKAKEAGMMFEEDVASVLKRSVPKDLRVVRGRIHNGAPPTFIADFSIEDQKSGEIQCSLVCKSSPRADRLQLALAEAMIGKQKTGEPVIVVVPYLMDDEPTQTVLEQFRSLGYLWAELPGLVEILKTVFH